MGRVWPLTGRSEELRYVAAALRRPSAPRGVVLAGAAGVGKTRLAREAMAEAGRRGAVTRWAVATASARSLPLGAFSTLLGGLDDETRPGGPGSVLDGSPSEVLPKAVAALSTSGNVRHGPGRGTSPGTVIGVDDAHLLDDLSAAVLHQLVLGTSATVVVTVRSRESAPDAVTALWKDGHLDRLELQPLSEPETAELLAATLGGPVDSVSAGRLWRLTRGNALFLRHVVDGEVDAGRLHKSAGWWRWSAAGPAVSAGLSELVGARLSGLAEPVREVVDVLAFGEPLGASLLGRLTDPDAVEQAETTGLVTIERDGRRVLCRLSHPLLGDVRRAACGELRARRIRGRLASAVAATGARRADDTVRRALLAVDSDLPADPDLLSAGARGAALLIDLPLAERLAHAAVAAGAGFDAQLTATSILVFNAGRDPVDGEIAALVALARSDVERAQAAVTQIAYLAWVRARPDDGERLLEVAEAAVRDPAARQDLTALRSTYEAFSGRPLRAARIAPALLAEPGLSPTAVVYAGWGLVSAYATTGRLGEIDAVTRRVRAAAAGAPTLAFFQVPVSGQQILAMRLAGLVDDAARLAREVRDLAGDSPMGAEIATCLLGVAHMAAGRVGAALPLLREARAGLAAYGPAGGWYYACLLDLTQAFALSGDVPGARQALADMVSDRHPGFAMLAPGDLLARAWVAAAQGSVSEATALAHEAAATAAGAGQLAFEVLALSTATCFGDPRPKRLAELAELVDGPRAPAAAAHAAALADDDGDALRAASEELERMGDLLTAADAAAQAASAYRRRNRRGPAQAAAARAHQLGEACGVRTPALDAAAWPLPITTREREIVTLAARGLTNREIADRLVVSVRTVEGHRYRACAKLGTTDRAELAAILFGEDAAG